MTIVAGGLGLPEDGAIVAGGLGQSGAAGATVRNMAATLAGVGSLTASAEASGGEQPPASVARGGSQQIAVAGSFADMAAGLYGAATVSASAVAWQDIDAELEQLLLVGVI